MVDPLRRSSVNPAVKLAGETVFDGQGRPKPGTQRVIERAIDVQRPLVLANLRRLRRKYPHATALELSVKLEREYLGAITAGGAAVGATAVVPTIGTVAALGLSAAATVGFLEATALYAQSVAELHGVQTSDPMRARTMVMAILMGEEGTALIQSMLGAGDGRGATQYWGTVVGGAMPSSMVRTIGASIRKRFLKRMLARQGGVFLGRALPFGIGAAVGGAGNHIMGRSVIKATRVAFGPPPVEVPGGLLELLEHPDSPPVSEPTPSEDRGASG